MDNLIWIALGIAVLYVVEQVLKTCVAIATRRSLRIEPSSYTVSVTTEQTISGVVYRVRVERGETE